MTLEDFPPDTASPLYDDKIIEHITSGDYDPVQWAEITSNILGHSATFYVMADAFKIQGVRVNVSANLEQTLADLMGCLLMTPKIADLIWLQRQVTLQPQTRAITSKLEDMIANSRAIDAQLAAQGNPTGLISTVGKDWTLSNSLLSYPGKAQNYGDHCIPTGTNNWRGIRTYPLEGVPTPAAAGQVIQGAWWFHGPTHIDYSQTCRLVRRDCLVDDHPWDLADLLRDSTLSKLAAADGPLKLLRQPNVPLIACKTKIGMSGPPEILDYKGATITIDHNSGVWAASWVFGAHRGDVQGSSRGDVLARAQAWIDDKSGVCPMPPGVSTPASGKKNSAVAIAVGVVAVAAGGVWWWLRR